MEIGSFHGRVFEHSGEISIRNALKTAKFLSSPCAQTGYLFQAEPFRPFPAVLSVMLNKVGSLWASSHIGCMDFKKVCRDALCLLVLLVVLNIYILS